MQREGSKPKTATAELGTQLEAITRAVSEGLSLRGAAALQGIAHRRLAAIVALAEHGHEPQATWLVALLRQDAESRRAVLEDLKKLAAVDSGARRDLYRAHGQPSPLERELDLLRRSPRAEDDTGELEQAPAQRAPRVRPAPRWCHDG